jgi:phenylpyruvate tautomerase PptA (4-oxalocrotonate tautomerase family)
MPMWQVFVPEDAYTPDEKQAFGEDITKIYAENFGLPRFYVNVIFNDVPSRSFLIGGEFRDNFVRISVDHIARSAKQVSEHMQLPADTNWGELWLQMIKDVITRHVADRGFNWELHVDETPVEYWYIDGLVPPPGWSEEEQRWAAENRATPPVATQEARA